MKTTVIAIAAIAVMYSCRSANWETIKPEQPNSGCDTTKTISFSADLKPIFNKSCGAGDSSCHNSFAQSAGVWLEDYASTKAAVGAGQIPQCVNGDPNMSAMPVDGSGYTLDNCDKKSIIRWVSAGAANN